MLLWRNAVEFYFPADNKKKHYLKMKSAVEQLLKAKRESRSTPGIVTDLFPYDKCIAKKHWDESVPILTLMAEAAAAKDFCSPEEIRAKIPESIHAILKIPGIALAGGALFSLLTNQPVADWDLFLIDEDGKQDGFRMKINLIASMLQEWKGARYEEVSLEVARNARCITFWILLEDLKVQIILRRYPNVAALLHSFDRGACNFAFYRGTVWTTGFGKFLLEYGADILDLTCVRNTHDLRIAKYLKRGVAMVLPDLDVSKITGSDVLLPRLWLRNVTQQKNVVRAEFVYARHESGRAVGFYEDPEYYTSYIVAERNLRCVNGFGGLAPGNMCALADYVSGMDVTSIPPTLSGLGLRLSWWIGDGSRPKMERLSAAVGSENAVRLLEAVIKKEKIDFHKLEQQVQDSVKDRLVLPFTFADATSENCLTIFPQQTVSISEWYGHFLLIQ